MEYSPHRGRALFIGLALLAIASGVAAAFMGMIQARTEIDTWTTEKAEVVEALVLDVFNGVFADLDAMAGFVEQSDPSVSSFAGFVQRIDGSADAIGVGYVAVIDRADAEQHIAERRAALGDFYDIYGLNGETAMPEPLDRSGRTTLYPVQLFYFGPQILPLLSDDIPIEQLGLGVEAGFREEWREEIEVAASAGERTLSGFIKIEADSFAFDRAFFASVPVMPTDGRSPGFVAALMLEPLLLQNLDSGILDDVLWEVVPIGGQPERIESDAVQLYDLDLPSTPWQLAVSPTEEALRDLYGRSAWITGLITASMSAAGAVLLWLLIDRRRERTLAAQMKALANEKDRFLATVSHELRTPLTVVAGVASEIRDRPEGFETDELVSLHEMIVEETDELTAIVEDLLVAARSDITQVAVTQQSVDLIAEAKNAVRTSGAPAALTGDPTNALADPQRVRQILRNLLTNAVRYGGPDVNVKISANTNHVHVVVADNGDGIELAKRSLVFEPYTSAHESGTLTGSVGLGLYISRSLARAMGGDLAYSYDGVWSRFRLQLPAAECAIADRPKGDEETAEKTATSSSS